MPRFYFHLFNDEIMFDDVGQDFTDPGAARDGAIRGISELIAEHLAQGKAVDLAHRIDVADESGDVVQKIRFGDLFTYRGERLDLGPPQ